MYKVGDNILVELINPHSMTSVWIPGIVEMIGESLLVRIVATGQNIRVNPKAVKAG